MIHSADSAPQVRSKGATRPEHLGRVFTRQEFKQLMAAEIAAIEETSLAIFQDPQTTDRCAVVEEHARRVAFFIASKLPASLVAQYKPEEFVQFCAPVLESFRHNHWEWLAAQGQDPHQPMTRPQYLKRLRQFVTRHGYIAGQRLSEVLATTGDSTVMDCADGTVFSACEFLAPYVNTVDVYLGAMACEITASPLTQYRPIVERYLHLIESELALEFSEHLPADNQPAVLALLFRTLGAIIRTDVADRTLAYRTTVQKEISAMNTVKEITARDILLAYSHHIAANARDVLAAFPKFKHYKPKMRAELAAETLRYRTACYHWLVMTYGLTTVPYATLRLAAQAIHEVTMSYVIGDVKNIPFKRIPAMMINRIKNEPTEPIEVNMKAQNLFADVLMDKVEDRLDHLAHLVGEFHSTHTNVQQRLTEVIDQFSLELFADALTAEPAINAVHHETAVRFARAFMQTALREKTGFEWALVAGLDYPEDSTSPTPDTKKETAMLTTTQAAALIAADDAVQALMTTVRADALTKVQALCLLEKDERQAEIEAIDSFMTERKHELAELIRSKFEAATDEVINQIYQENIMSEINAAVEASATAAEEAVVESKSLFARLKLAASNKLATVKAYATSFTKKNVDAEEVVENKPMSRAAKIALVCAGVALVGAATAAIVAPAVVMSALAVVAGFISAALVACKDFFASLLAKLAGVFARTAEAAGEAAETASEAVAA